MGWGRAGVVATGGGGCGGGEGGGGGGSALLQNHLQSLEGAHAGRTCSSSAAIGEELKNSDE